MRWQENGRQETAEEVRPARRSRKVWGMAGLASSIASDRTDATDKTPGRSESSARVYSIKLEMGCLRYS